MKKKFFALVAGCIIAAVTYPDANAQNQVSAESQKVNAAIEKTIQTFNDLSNDQDAINPKALRDFTKRYKNAKATKWVGNKNGFFIDFSSDGVKNSIYYSPKGKWTGSVKNYTEDKLPDGIRNLVRHAYYDYAIFHVKEIENEDSNGIPTYIVYLENNDSYKSVRVYDWEMDIIEDFKKL
ncbi:MAG: hypothetical protein ABUT20_31695 [Bacteroidota bacterium]